MATVNVKPLGDRVLVQPLEEQEVKKGGIIIPDTAKEKPQEGKVVALGTGKIDENAPGPERALRRLGLRRFHRDLARRVDRRLAPDHRDLVLLHEEADAVIEALRHPARAFHHGGRIVGDLLGGQAVVLGVLHVMVDLGRAQQRLGRNASPVQANAAEPRALDDRGLEAELRCADRGDVAAGAGADDDDVEGFGHWGLRIVLGQSFEPSVARRAPTLSHGLRKSAAPARTHAYRRRPPAALRPAPADCKPLAGQV